MSRYDSFIIWGNGLKNIDGIFEHIRSDNNFDVIRIAIFGIENMKQFINAVYGCDTFPMDHLIAKTKYLLKEPKYCVFILVKNKNPDVEHFGSGAFAHNECKNVKKLKIKIRNEYNPSFKDSTKQVKPLNVGVSHDHCIHTTDYESQTEYLLNAFGLGSLQYYKRHEAKSEYYIPYHLEPTKFEELEVNIDDLLVNTAEEKNISIEKTPHFDYVNGNKKPYIEYFQKHFGTKLQEDHFPIAFDNLIKTFNIDYIREDGKKSFILVHGNIVQDGLHRLCILKKMGIEKTKVLLIG